MAKLIFAECKTCHSKLIIDTEQESVFCPYCGTQVVQRKKALSLNMQTFKNLFQGPKEKDYEAGVVIPNDEDANVETYTCYLCSESTLVDTSKEDGFCKNCGGQIRKNGKMITPAPEPEKNESFSRTAFIKKYKLQIIVAVCVLLFIVCFIISKSAGSSVPETSHDKISETTNDQNETQAEPPTMKPTEKSTGKPTEKPTEGPTEVPTTAPTQKPTEEKIIPIDVPDGFTVLQAFFCQCNADSDMEDLEEFARQCGLYTYQFSYRSDYLDLEISAEPFSKKVDNSEMYEFPGDYIHIVFDTYTGSTRFSRINYHFNDKRSGSLRLEYVVIRWEDGSEVVSYRSFDIKEGETTTDSYQDAESAISAAIEMDTNN